MKQFSAILNFSNEIVLSGKCAKLFQLSNPQQIINDNDGHCRGKEKYACVGGNAF